MQSLLSTLPWWLLFLCKSSIAAYVLEDSFNSSNFYNEFSFFTASDPTHGFVQYLDGNDALSKGLFQANDDSVYLGVDSNTTSPSGGRASLRLTSNKSYNQSLIVADIAHMPGGVCGTWPAFWTVGPNWPLAGEIDIIEGVNDQSLNDMTLHTSGECTISPANSTGTLSTTNCYVDAPGQSANSGCQYTDVSSSSFGTAFNAQGGGVFAMELTDAGIKIWSFSHGNGSNVPADLRANSAAAPDPSAWGAPSAFFTGAGCDFAQHFYSQQLVFDTTFCGDWAGAAWASSSCASQAATCEDFVSQNPAAFQEAYWEVRSIDVYTAVQQTATSATATSTAGSTATAISNGGENTSVANTSGGHELVTVTGTVVVATCPCETEHSSLSTKPDDAVPQPTATTPEDPVIPILHPTDSPLSELALTASPPATQSPDPTLAKRTLIPDPSMASAPTSTRPLITEVPVSLFLPNGSRTRTGFSTIYFRNPTVEN